MIVSLVFLFLFILLCAFLMMFFFNFFIPALKIKYDINGTLSSEKHSLDNLFEKLPQENLNFRAVVKAGGEKSALERRMIYSGDRNCDIFAKAYKSEYKDAVCCCGFGDCVKKCPQNAIVIKNGTAIVTDLCSGCGECVKNCPLGLISMLPKNELPEDESHFKIWKTLYKILKK